MPAGPLSPDRYGATAWPLVGEQQRLPRKVFRRSIAWLSDSLSTLRRAGYPASTQDSLPAVGQTLLGGLFTRKVPSEGFRVLGEPVQLRRQPDTQRHPVDRDAQLT